MPIYEYQCLKCEAVTEKLQGVHDAPLRKCPKCGGRVEKKMSAGSFVFKGSGFYATDYPKGNGGNGSGRTRKPGKPAESSAPTCPAQGGEGSPACAGCPKAE